MKDRFYEIAKNALADFRKLPAPNKYKECVNYGNLIAYTDTNTTDGWLTSKIFEIYGTEFIFVLVAGEVINCYEIQ